MNRGRARIHLRLAQAKLDRARRVLGTRTDGETVERAPELVIAVARVRRRPDGGG